MMKVWAKRHRDLSRQHNRVACRLHSVLCDLVPGGITGEISPAQATRLLDGIEPHGAVAAARHQLAVELVDDLVRLNTQRREARRRIAAAVAASKTTVTELSGSDRSSPPPSSATSATSPASPAATTSPPTTAPPRSKCPPVVGARCSGCRGAATVASTTPSTWPPSPRSGSDTPKDAATSTARSPKATPAKKRSGHSKRRISDAIYTRLRDDARATGLTSTGPGGQPGNDTETCVTGSHPEHRRFGRATPGPTTTLRPTNNRVRPSRPKTPSPTVRKNRLTNKEDSICVAWPGPTESASGAR